MGVSASSTPQTYQILVGEKIYILDPGLFLRYSQYKLAGFIQMRPPGWHWIHKAIQPRCHPGFLSPHRTIADLDNFPPFLSNRILAKSVAFSDCLESHDAERWS